jgi:CHASE3 domain sensor protein
MSRSDTIEQLITKVEDKVDDVNADVTDIVHSMRDVLNKKKGYLLNNTEDDQIEYDELIEYIDDWWNTLYDIQQTLMR